MFDFRLRMCDPDGTAQEVLIDAINPTVTFVDSSTATLSFHVQREFTDVPNEAFVVAVEYTNDNGQSWKSPRNDLFMVDRDNRDNVQVADLVAFSGVSYLSWLMGKALLHWSESAVDGERLWLGPNKSAVTAAYIIRGMIDEAKNRGWGPWFEYDFTGASDSLGQAWLDEDKVKQSFALQTPLTQALSSLSEQGLCDWWTEGMMLRMVRGGTGVDRTQAVTIGGEGFTEGARRTSAADTFTHLTVIPEKSRYWLYLNNPGADTRFGRLEATMTQSGVEDHTTAARLAQPALVGGRAPVNEWTYSYRATVGMPSPFTDFNVGDNVSVLGRVSVPVTLRVVGLVLTRPDGVATVDVVVGQKLLTQQARRAKRTDAASVGGTVNGAIGGSGSALPSGRPRPYPQPGVPSGLSVVSNVGYFSDDGTARARVELSWNPVVTDELGSELTDVTQYEVWHRVPPATGARAIPTEETTLVVDSWESGVERAVKVRAMSGERVWGDHSPEITVTPALPPVKLDPPTAPVVDGAMATITATWGGLLTTGAPGPGLRFVVTEESASFAGTYTRVGQPLGKAGASTWPADIGAVRWVRFRAVDMLGRESDPSTSVQVTVQGIVDQAINDAIEAALNAANSAQSTADGKTTISPNAPTNADGAGKPTGAIWWRRNSSGAVIGLWEWTGSAPWVVRPFDESFVPQINIGAGTYGELDGVRLKAASVLATSILVGDITNMALDVQSAAERAAYPAQSSFRYVSSVNSAGGTAAPWTVFLDPGTGYQTTSVGEPFQVLPGEKIFMSFMARRGASVNVPASLNLRVQDANGTIISQDVRAATAPVSAPADTWVTYEGFATIPAGGAYAYPQFKRNSAGEQTGLWLLSTPIIRRAAAGELVVDGAITTRTLAADAVTAAKLDAGAVKARNLAVGVGETGQRLELVGTGMTVFDADGNPTIRLGTATDDVLAISQKNSQGELVTVAAIDTDGNITGASLTTDSDITHPAALVVGGAGELTYNGQFIDTAFMERPPMGIIWSASLGEDSGSGRLQVYNSTASVLALGIAEVTLNPGRQYTVGVDQPFFANWVSGSTGNSLVLQIWIGSSPQSVTSPNGVLAAQASLLLGGDDNGVARATYPFTGSVQRGLSGTKYVLCRVVNSSNRPANYNTNDRPPNIIIRDEGPDVDASDGGVIYTRASTGNVTPPATANTTKTVVFNAAWSVLWGPSGSIRPSGGSLYDDGRMLHGGLSGSRAGQVGFPALGLSGKTITGAWIRLKNRHTYSTAGATVDIGTHGNGSAPTGSAPNNANTFTAKFSKGQERWVPIPSSLWASIASGSIRGFQIGGPNVNSGSADYGIFDGYSTTNATGSGRVRPQLKISYKG